MESRKVFLDTSVIFAAVFSPSGGARKLFRLGEIGLIQLCLGPNVLRECEEVVRRKVPASLPKLALLLDLGRVEVAAPPSPGCIARARKVVAYEPDRIVLAEAIHAGPDWFVTHDKKHVLRGGIDEEVPFRIGTPGDVIRALAEEISG